MEKDGEKRNKGTRSLRAYPLPSLFRIVCLPSAPRGVSCQIVDLVPIVYLRPPACNL